MFELAHSDLHRKQSHYLLTGSFVEKYIMTTLQLGTLAVFVYRFAAWVHTRPWPLRLPLTLLAVPAQVLSQSLTGIRLPAALPIGPGFIIHNFSSIHIDAAAVGENFTVNQGVSVGPDWTRQGRPVLGNNVFLGSGAKVLGAITLGDNVVVAANALVIRSVPDNCTVAGVPARVISRDGNSSYLQLKSAPTSAATNASTNSATTSTPTPGGS
jgi:serine O-acetyltransferase